MKVWAWSDRRRRAADGDDHGQAAEHFDAKPGDRVEQPRQCPQCPGGAGIQTDVPAPAQLLQLHPEYGQAGADDEREDDRQDIPRQADREFDQRQCCP